MPINAPLSNSPFSRLLFILFRARPLIFNTNHPMAGCTSKLQKFPWLARQDDWMRKISIYSLFSLVQLVLSFVLVSLYLGERLGDSFSTTPTNNQLHRVEQRLYSDGEIPSIASPFRVCATYDASGNTTPGDGRRVTGGQSIFGNQLSRSKAFCAVFRNFADEARQRDQRRPYADGREPVVLTSEFEDIPSNLTSQQSWQEKYPTFNVVGFPKAGTSHLYRLLMTHKDVQKFNFHKENCRPVLRGKDQIDVNKALFQYYNQLDAPAAKTVNGCAQFEHARIHLTYLNITKANLSQKFFLIFRDPATWLWASWNFWAGHLDSARDTKNSWTDKHLHYRSPELFHELIASGAKTVVGKNTLNKRESLVQTARNYVQLVGRENILFLRAEDMRPSIIQKKGGALDQIVSFTGLDRSGFDETTLGQIANCGDHKGIDNTDGCRQEASTSYEISQNRSILEATRALIYTFFWEECKTLSEEFGIVYPDCLSVMDP